MTGRHPSPRPTGRPGDRATPAGDDLIAAERAGVPTAELIARAERHRLAVERAHPHLHLVPDPTPAPTPGSDAWYGVEPVPEMGSDAWHEQVARRLAARQTAEQAAGEAPTVWREVCHLVAYVARLESTLRAQGAHLAQLSARLEEGDRR